MRKAARPIQPVAPEPGEAVIGGRCLPEWEIQARETCEWQAQQRAVRQQRARMMTNCN